MGTERDKAIGVNAPETRTDDPPTLIEGNLPNSAPRGHADSSPKRLLGTSQGASRSRSLLGAWVSNYALLIGWMVLIVVFSALRPQSFRTVSNFQTILSSQAVLAILSLGVLAIVLVDEFDLSVGATLGFSGVIVGVLNVQHHLPILTAVLVAVVAGCVIGAVNGILVVYVGVEGLIATLGIGTLVTGLGFAISSYLTIGGISSTLVNAVTTKILGTQIQFYYAFGLGIIVWYLYEFTPWGRHLLFVGKGREVARLSGLPERSLRMAAFVFAGALAAVAGVVLTGSLGSADPTIGAGYLLPPYAAVFLGSTVVRPGRFNPVGTLVAVYFLATGITGFELLGLQTWIQDVFYGLALVLAITLARLVATRQVRRSRKMSELRPDDANSDSTKSR